MKDIYLTLEENEVECKTKSPDAKFIGPVTQFIW